MKFVLTVVAFLVCVSNLHHCQAKKWKKRPSAHIVAVTLGEKTYTNMVIKDFSATLPEGRLEGKMAYKDGQLTVPKPGVYNIYAQIYFTSKARVVVYVNLKPVFLLQPPTGTTQEGTVGANGWFRLEAGDVIYLKAVSYPVASTKLYMQPLHTFFGAHRVGV